MKIQLTLLLVLTSIFSMTACKHTAQDAQANPLNPTSGAAATGTSATAAPSADMAEPQAAQPITIPPGTALNVRLQSTVSSAQSRTGDRFEAVLDEPLVVGGQTVAPTGTPIIGRVLDAESSGRLEHPGKISVALVSMNLDGHALALSTSSLSAKGQGHKRRNTEWIGGGAVGGALFGGLLGGGKGALIGSAAGAGAGTATAAATGKHDVAFGGDRRLTFRLTQPATVPARS